MTDHSGPYSAKAEAYAQYRWDYAPAAFDQICKMAGLGPQSVVADIGAGTGLVSAHFLTRVGRVIAVEPNADMRRLSEKNLSRDRKFVAVAGYAHATGLPESSIDLVAVGRAIHWFNHEAARAEFLRILRPGGWLAVLYTPTTDAYLTEAMQRLRNPALGWQVERSKRHDLVPVWLRFYFDSAEYQTLTVPGQVYETWEQFFGRISSLSSAPNPGDPHYDEFVAAARAIFEHRAADGQLHVRYATLVTLRRIKPPLLQTPA